MEENKANRIAELILKYLREELTEEDKGRLEEWKNESPANEAFFDEITNEENLSRDIEYLLELEERRAEKFSKLEKKLFPSEDGK